MPRESLLLPLERLGVSPEEGTYKSPTEDILRAR